ncbi:hypothetical protein [Cyanobium sp. Morenito 9A2]|nr:hypothetical protein [Cyanobium sp. Morenito 9A2]MCP9848705.1 hypothetical protein [Cyanobium sp. Morenito 9A2]
MLLLVTNVFAALMPPGLGRSLALDGLAPRTSSEGPPIGSALIEPWA